MDDAAAADDRISTTQAGAETREGIRLLPDVWIIDLPTIAPGAGSGVGAVREGGVLEWCGGGKLRAPDSGSQTRRRKIIRAERSLFARLPEEGARGG
jgi:hypothetical protein